ncbi:hypothetical protein C7E17_27330, partial [Stenotrophomonas maltophilia]
IFKPLGMNDASLGLAGIQASSRWARPHVRSRNGRVYEQSVERRIFKPLGMNDASLGLAGIQASSRWAR